MKKFCIFLILTFIFFGCASYKASRLKASNESITVGRYDARLTLDKPVHEIFEWACDFRNYDRMVPWLDFDLSDDPLITKVGDYAEINADVLGTGISVRFIVVQFEKDRLIKMAFAGDVRGSMTMEMEPDGERTRSKFSFCAFMLPGSIASDLTQNLIGREDLVRRLSKENFSDIFCEIKAQMEGAEVQPDCIEETSYRVYPDAYFTTDVNFPVASDRISEIFASAGGLKSILSADMMTPVGNSPEHISGVGNHYRLTFSGGLASPLTYDMVVVRHDPPDMTGYFFYADDVSMELDFLAYPSFLGTKVMVLYIVDLPDQAGVEHLDYIIHTSGLDSVVEDNLNKIKNELD